MPLRLSEQQFRHLQTGKPIGRTRRSKYGNTKTVVDGQTFDSKFEAQTFQALCLRVKLGEIRNLRTQVTFPLMVNAVLICRYVADFVWDEVAEDGRWHEVVADAKSNPTRKNAAYVIKRKLMLALHHPIREIVSTRR